MTLPRTPQHLAHETLLRRPAHPYHAPPSKILDASNTAEISEELDFAALASDEFRAWFLLAFADWLQNNFRNPDQVAQAFGVRKSTAWNWWKGSHRATGDVIASVFLGFPGARDWFQTRWARRS